jgi:hypothetical protein
VGTPTPSRKGLHGITGCRCFPGRVHQWRGSGKADSQTFSLDDFAQYTIGSSPWHQISHTKGGVLDGIVGFEGSNFPKVIKGPVRGTPSNHIAEGGT